MTRPERSHTSSLGVSSSSHCCLLRSEYWQVNYFWSLLLSCWLRREAEAAWHDADQVLCWAFDSDFCCCIGIFINRPEANKWPQSPSPHPGYFQLPFSICVYLTFLPDFYYHACLQWCTLIFSYYSTSSSFRHFWKVPASLLYPRNFIQTLYFLCGFFFFKYPCFP